MFKLTIEIADLTELSQVVQKLGGVAIGGTIETAQEAPAAKAPASRSRSTKAKETVVETPSVDAGPTQSANTQNEPGVQSSASQTSPGPVAPAIDRKAYNDAAIAILNDKLKTSGLSGDQLGDFMVNTFIKAGCPGGKITTISDEQMLRFFPIFKQEVDNLLASKSQAATSFV